MVFSFVLQSGVIFGDALVIRQETWHSRIQLYGFLFCVTIRGSVRLPRVELGSIAWKAIILTVGLQAQLKSTTKRKYVENLILCRFKFLHLHLEP